MKIIQTIAIGLAGMGIMFMVVRIENLEARATKLEQQVQVLQVQIKVQATGDLK